MFQELGEGADVIHGEAREALPDGLRRRLNPPKPRRKAKAPRPITCRTAIDQPLKRLSGSSLMRGWGCGKRCCPKFPVK